MENKKNILIVVDMQNDFVSGSLGSSDAVKILGNIRSKIKSYDSDDNGVIVFTRDTHRRNYLNTLEGRKLPVEHCIYNTKGWEIVDELNAPLEKTKKCIVDKGSFGFPEWERELSYMGLTSNNISGIELCGVCTDICVISNALILKALYPETEISVDATCCAGTSVDAHFAALSVMENCQVNIKR